MSTLEEDLKPFQTVDLAAEVARRLGAGPPPAPRAAPAKKAAKPFLKKSEWAAARVKELEANLEKVAAEYATADNLRRKQTSMDAISAEIRKFKRIAAAAQSKGE